ncbi:hypothetical protein SLS56_005861 [Neofusicoccum ribis]|uniref:Nephrocystin 3-like N-terminal domain-containing protein n=1 Tax=Neofusicoccum ribis TaxID=45134 RepID=A0ABR3STA1_9PEZI
MAADHDAEDMEQLWRATLEKYKGLTGISLEDQPLTREEMDGRIKMIRGHKSDVIRGPFAPASVIFAAAKCLIGIGDRYRNYFTAKNVLEIIESLKPHLERFKIYVGYAKKGITVQEPIVRYLFNLLEHFFGICAFYSVLESNSRNPFKKSINFFGAVVGNGKQVQSHLREIENLAKHEQSLTLAAIYSMSRYAEKVRAGKKKPPSKDAKTGSAESKQAQPSEEEDVEDVDPAIWKSWAEVEKEMKASFIKEVGSWLVKHEIFSAWMMVQLHKSDTTLSQAEPTLIIQGNDGLGKSYLAYQAATTIKSEVKSRPQELSLAAFYFRSPECNPKTNHTDEKSYTLRDALLAIIRQLMRSDPNYREFVAEKCGLTGLRTKMSAIELWDRLVIGYTVTRRRKAFFIIIDGLNHTKREENQEEGKVYRHIIKTSLQLRGSSTTFQVRVLFTGTKEIFQEYSECNSRQQGQINISPTESRFREDMELYIRKRLERAREHDTSDIAQFQELLSKIEVRLIESNPMSYPSADAFLEDIETAIMIENLQLLQGRNFNESAETLPWRIRKLNFSLEEAEIDALNSILAYVFLMQDGWPTIQQLELLLDRDHDGSLEAEIRDNFRSLFTLRPSGDDIVVQAKHEISKFITKGRGYENELAEYIPQRKRLPQRKELPPGNSYFENGQEIQHETSRGQSDQKEFPKRQIEFSPKAGHFQFVGRILEILCTSGTPIIDNYGQLWLPYHLNKVDLAYLNSEDYEKKNQIGYYLFKFLFDEKIVKKCMNFKVLRKIRKLSYNWRIFLTEGVTDWLQDQEVRSGAQHYVDEMQGHKLYLQDFIEELETPGNLSLPRKNWENRSLVLMRQEVARNWMTCYEWDATEAYHFSKTPDENIMPLMTWATKEVLDIGEESLPTQIIRLSQTFYGLDIHEGLLHICEMILDLGGRNTEAAGKVNNQQVLDRIKELFKEAANKTTVERIKKDAEAEAEAKKFQGKAKEEVTTQPVENAEEETGISENTSLLSYFNRWLGPFSTKENAEEEAAKTTLPNPVSTKGNSEDKAVKTTSPSKNEEHKPLSPQEMLKVAMCLAQTYLARSKKTSPTSSTDRDLAFRALEIIKRSLEKKDLDPKTRADHDEMLEWIWDFHECLDNTDRAVEKPKIEDSIKTALELCGHLLRHYPKDKGLVSKALSLLERGDHDVAYYKFLLHNTHTEYDSPNTLTTLIRQRASFAPFHEQFFQACRSDPKFIQKAYAEARIYDNDEPKISTHIRYYYGVVLFSQDKVDEAVLLWKESVPYEEFTRVAKAKLDPGVLFKNKATKQVLSKTSIDQEDEQRWLLECQIKTAERLASAYIGLARKTREQAVKDKYVRKTQKIKYWMESNVLAVPEVGLSPGLMVLHGRVMQVSGDAKGAADCIRPLIEHALQLLYDEEAGNDWEAYLMLAQAFTPLEDDKNALAAWALLDPVDNDDEHCRVFSCAGRCGLDWKGGVHCDMHICRDCVSVQFGPGCLERHLSGALDGRVCRKDHEFLKVPKWTRKARMMKESGQVDVGGTPKLIKDWLNDVRLQYGISRSDVGLPKRRLDAIRDVKWRLRTGLRSLGGDSS